MEILPIACFIVYSLRGFDNKVYEVGAKYIIKIESSDGKIANQIKNNTKNKNETILTLNSLQSVDLKNYKSYIEVMDSNLDILIQALS